MTRWHIDMPNDADITDLLGTWVPDEKLREQILVQNPTRLYFSA
jgi:predicted TIM-barrel fold metal-dependent hydrolase